MIGYMIDDSKMEPHACRSAQSYVDAIKSGQSATVSIPTAMSEVSGTVSSVDTTHCAPRATACKVFRVVISVNNASGTLTKGMTATATVNTAGSAGHGISRGFRHARDTAGKRR